MVVGCHDGKAVGADLIGGIAIRRDAVCTDDDGVYFLVAHDGSGHRIGNEAARDMPFHELSRGEAAPLQERTCLIRIHALDRPTLMKYGEDAEGRADACRRQCSRIAVGQDAKTLSSLEKVCAIFTDGATGVNIFRFDITGLCKESIPRFFGRISIEDLLHLGNGPGQIHGSRTRRADLLAGVVKGSRYIRGHKALSIGEEDGIGSRDTDRRSSAHCKDADGIGYLTVVPAA